MKCIVFSPQRQNTSCVIRCVFACVCGTGWFSCVESLHIEEEDIQGEPLYVDDDDCDTLFDKIFGI